MSESGCVGFLEGDQSAGELEQGEVVLGFLRPADQERAVAVMFLPSRRGGSVTPPAGRRADQHRRRRARRYRHSSSTSPFRQRAQRKRSSSSPSWARGTQGELSSSAGVL